VGLIDKTEQIQLDAIRNLRNQYAHPTAAAPSHHEAEHALRTAVEAVLVKETLMMHGAEKQLAERAVTDRHFLAPETGAIVRFTQTRAARIHVSARPLFVRTLIEGAHAQLQRGDDVLADRCLLMAAMALTQWEEPL
jgi:hypothetical protein